MDSQVTTQPTRLREWREAAGLTLQEAADLGGCSTAMLSRMERGQRRPSPRLKVALARRLGVRVGELFDVDPIAEDDDNSIKEDA
jgi:transcriptional regulator with XRE-family HTH domain